MSNVLNEEKQQQVVLDSMAAEAARGLRAISDRRDAGSGGKPPPGVSNARDAFSTEAF
jgi:hypothetical protein